MSATVTCAGADVLRGHVVMPIKGAWWADLRLDAQTAPSGQVTFESLDGLSVKGTVVAASVELDTAHVRVVGGAGGLDKKVKGSFKSARLSDPLNAIARASGESLASDISSSLLSLSLTFWTIGSSEARRAISSLVHAAGERLGEAVNWRFNGDGKLWLGTESWATAKLGAADVITDVQPAEGRTVVGVQSLALLPGQNVDGIGKARAVEHWISPSALRTWVWL